MTVLKWIAANVLAVGAIPLSWDKLDNFGDKLNPILVSWIARRRVSRMPYGYGASYFAVGSILQRAGRQSYIWGSGFISSGSIYREPPAKIFAVRGPLTASILRRSGTRCPDVFGDPVLLLPKFFSPESKRTHMLGVIPHYADKSSPALEYYSERNDVKIINVQGGIDEFIHEVLSCEYIASSSLHGLVVAEAYGIPSTHIILGDRVVGGQFKFRDYRLGIGGAEHRPVEIMDRLVDVDSIIRAASLFPVHKAQDALLRSCPFFHDVAQRISVPS